MSSDFEHKGSTRRHCPWQTSRTAHTSPLFCSARAHAAPASSAWCTCAGASGGPPTGTGGGRGGRVEGEEGVAEVAVVLAGAGGQALDGGVGHVDGVGDHGGGGISLRRGG